MTREPGHASRSGRRPAAGAAPDPRARRRPGCRLSAVRLPRRDRARPHRHGLQRRRRRRDRRAGRRGAPSASCWHASSAHRRRARASTRSRSSRARRSPGAAASSSPRAATRRRRPRSAPTRRPARPALPNCAIRRTGATATPSRTAPTADRASRSPGRCPTTARRPASRRSRCAPIASASTARRATGASTPRRPPVRCAARGCALVGGAPGEDPIAGCLRLLRSGRIVAIKGLGGYHLACDAADAAAVARLRARKQREEQPFALMVANVDSLAAVVETDAAERALLESAERPIVLLRRRAAAHDALPGVADGLEQLGVMLPYTPIHFLLFHEAAGRPAGTGVARRAAAARARDDERQRARRAAGDRRRRGAGVAGRHRRRLARPRSGDRHALRRHA